MDYVDQAHWDSSYRNLKFSRIHDRVTDWMRGYIEPVPQGVRKAAYEIGCFPGGYLAFLGERGYELNGCDLTPRTAEMTRWLLELGMKVGSVENTDFATVDSSEKYDLVYSLGFIEHFERYTDVIRAHDRLVRPGGYLILACPNFRGFVQNWLHRKLDNENLMLHNVDAMDHNAWVRVVADLGYSISYAGCFGGFDFWSDRSLGVRSSVIDVIRITFRLIGKLGRGMPNNAAWSPYVGLIAQKY